MGTGYASQEEQQEHTDGAQDDRCSVRAPIRVTVSFMIPYSIPTYNSGTQRTIGNLPGYVWKTW